MFEKEAEERITEQYGTSGEYITRQRIWQDGAEFGYKKGFEECAKSRLNVTTISDCPIKDEWHYVKDGDLPRISDSTLCELMPVFVAVKVGYKISTYGTYWNLRTGKFECLDKVYAWCYTPEPPEPPKESE